MLERPFRPLVLIRLVLAPEVQVQAAFLAVVAVLGEVAQVAVGSQGNFSYFHCINKYQYASRCLLSFMLTCNFV